MARATKEYQKIIAGLDGMTDLCTTDAELRFIQEAMDIISDYEKVVVDSNRMIQHYETPEKARRVSEDLYICPNCGKRVHYNHSHCHYCGKRLGWINRLR